MIQKIIFCLSTHYQPFYGFSINKVFFLAIMSLTHIIDKLSLLISKYNVNFSKYKVILYAYI